MSSVVPMKLVPINDMYGQGDNSLDLPTLTTSSVAIGDKINKSDISSKIGDLSNLDKELLEILHNNDLTEDAKARLYWVSLHKAEIYKDKSMWTEPVIVELRENRFIPVPIRKNGNEPLINTDQTVANIDDSISVGNNANMKRKRMDDVIEDVIADSNKRMRQEEEDENRQLSNKRKRMDDVIEDVITDSNKRMRQEEEEEAQNRQLSPRQQIQRIPPKLSQQRQLQILPTPERVATKRKLIPDQDSEVSNDRMLRKMAKINRIQSNLTQDEFDKNVKIGEPLIVYDTPDQSIPTTSSIPTLSSLASNRLPQQRQPTTQTFTDDTAPDYERPAWMRRFFTKIDEKMPKKTPADIKQKIKSLVLDIYKRDQNFSIDNKSMSTSQNLSAKILYKTDPLPVLQNYVKGIRRGSRQLKPFYDYLAYLGILDQTGSGFKRIRKWVKL
jgi:hypothetical protein